MPASLTIPVALYERVEPPHGVQVSYEAEGAEGLTAEQLLECAAFEAFGDAENRCWPRLWITGIVLSAIAEDGSKVSFISPASWRPTEFLRPPGAGATAEPAPQEPGMRS
jgi:hypothetical protein